MSICYILYIYDYERNTMMLVDYLKKVEEICKHEFMSGRDLINELGISYNTLLRIKRTPEKCSPRIGKKIKRFVEDYGKNH
jgi:hypothetical protein